MAVEAAETFLCINYGAYVPSESAFVPFSFEDDAFNFAVKNRDPIR